MFQPKRYGEYVRNAIESKSRIRLFIIKATIVFLFTYFNRENDFEGFKKYTPSYHR